MVMYLANGIPMLLKCVCVQLQLPYGYIYCVYRSGELLNSLENSSLSCSGAPGLTVVTQEDHAQLFLFLQTDAELVDAAEAEERTRPKCKSRLPTVGEGF